MRSFFLALGMMVLAGCATQATIRPTATAVEKISAGQGAVALRLTVGGPGVSWFFAFWDSIRVKGIDTGKNESIYDISLSTDGAAGSATYFGALPEGNYRIQMLSSEQCGAICIRSSSRFGDDGPSFTVEKGRLTYLGNLIYVSLSDKRSALVAKPVIDSENFQRWLKTYYPGFASMPLSRQVDTFGRDEAAYRRAQDYTIGYLGGVVLPQGSVLFHNFSSSLREVIGPTKVRTISTGLNSRISALLPLGAKNWIVSGDFNEARETLDGGMTWKDVQPDFPEGAVRALYRGKESELLVFMEKKGSLNVYAGNFGGAWRLLWSDAFGRSLLRGGIDTPRIQPNDDRSSIFVVLPGRPSYQLDTRSYKRKEFELPGAISQAAVSGDGVIRCQCDKTGMWMSAWESRDGGESWQDSEVSRYLPLPYFRNKEIGFNTHATGIFRTSDGGKTWTQVYAQDRSSWPVPGPFNYVFVNENRIVATDAQRMLILSEDGGMSWTQVRDLP